MAWCTVIESWVLHCFRSASFEDAWMRSSTVRIRYWSINWTQLRPSVFELHVMDLVLLLLLLEHFDWIDKPADSFKFYSCLIVVLLYSWVHCLAISLRLSETSFESFNLECPLILPNGIQYFLFFLLPLLSNIYADSCYFLQSMLFNHLDLLDTLVNLTRFAYKSLIDEELISVLVCFDDWFDCIAIFGRDFLYWASDVNFCAWETSLFDLACNLPFRLLFHYFCLSYLWIRHPLSGRGRKWWCTWYWMLFFIWREVVRVEAQIRCLLF